ETFLYPQSISSPSSVEEDLLNQNRLVPLEIKTYKDVNNDGYSDTSEQLSATKSIYDWFASGSVLEPKTIQTSKDSSLLTDRIEFKAYDSDGNILQVRKTDGIDICYIYGYDNYLPIAKIENAAYSQVQSYVTNLQFLSDADDDHCLDSGSCDEKCLRMALNTLRSSLPNALVTTYTYDPLIGVTSITDPRGDTIYYEYDDFNRLKHIKDSDGNILSKNEYHYSNQN